MRRSRLISQRLHGSRKILLDIPWTEREITMTQAKQSKADRKASAAARAEARPAQRLNRALPRIEQRINQAVARSSAAEFHKKAASPAAQAEVKSAYRSQCALISAAKAADRAEKANATIPAEAASNASAN